MNFTNEEILNLPTITELVGKMRKSENGFAQEEIFPLLDSYDFPLIALNNNAGNDQFIVSRLKSGRYVLKPNQTNRRFLFRGQVEYFEPCNPSVFREEKDLYIIENLKVEEFRILVRSHPLSMMFERGVKLMDGIPPFFFEMNYYGLAQHYDFKTAVLDFSSDIDVAAFFATSYRSEDGKYYPMEDENKVGVLYVHKMDPMSLSFGKFRNIGLQIFPRSGNQKGFLYESLKGHDINQNEIVKKYLFRHSKNASLSFYNKMNKGNNLFPKDELEPLARNILKDKDISLVALSDNLLNNKQSLEEMLKMLNDEGYRIDAKRKIVFSQNDLDGYYRDIRNGLWESFCNKIHFAGANGNKLKEGLLRLPKDNSYIQYFDKNYFNKISIFNRYHS